MTKGGTRLELVKASFFLISILFFTSLVISSATIEDQNQELNFFDKVINIFKSDKPVPITGHASYDPSLWGADVEYDFINLYVSTLLNYEGDLSEIERNGTKTSLIISELNYQGTTTGAVSHGSKSTFTLSEEQVEEFLGEDYSKTANYKLTFKVKDNSNNYITHYEKTGTIRLQQSPDNYNYQIGVVQVVPPGFDLEKQNLCFVENKVSNCPGRVARGISEDCVREHDWGTNMANLFIDEYKLTDVIFSKNNFTIFEDVQGGCNASRIKTYSLNYIDDFWEELLKKHDLTNRETVLGKNPSFDVTFIDPVEKINTLRSDDHPTVKKYFKEAVEEHKINIESYDFMIYMLYVPEGLGYATFKRGFAGGRNSYVPFTLGQDQIVLNQIFYTTVHEMGHQLFGGNDIYSGYGLKYPEGIPDLFNFPQEKACIMGKKFGLEIYDSETAKVYRTTDIAKYPELSNFDLFHTRHTENYVLCADTIVEILDAEENPLCSLDEFYAGNCGEDCNSLKYMQCVSNSCVDSDNDGIYAVNPGCQGGNDCNDNDNQIHSLMVEICDGKDNNCDGQTDEGCSCVGNAKRSCGQTNVGSCKKGTQTCTNGNWGSCTGEIKPVEEKECDFQDNDCDGLIDEDSGDIWYYDSDRDGYGNASVTRIDCIAPSRYSSRAGDCNDFNRAIKPNAKELCNGIDDNCNGNIDEGCECTHGSSRICGNSDIGECKKGTQTCVSGKWGSCNGEKEPVQELCDNKDNDCDGQIDEETGTLYYIDSDADKFGNIQFSKRSCSIISGYVSNTDDCNDNNRAINPNANEICDGNVDENCDGNVDENCDCINGATQSCGSNVGICQQGTQTCSNGKWGTCTGKTESNEEVCDGLDNDCDGQIDEGKNSLCEDNIYCTQDVCMGAQGCFFTENHGLCNDGLYCTGEEICSAELGECLSNNPIDCSDDYKCTKDICVESLKECKHTQKDNLCLVDQTCDIKNFPSPTGCGYIENCNDVDTDGILDFHKDLCLEGRDICPDTTTDFFKGKPNKIKNYRPKSSLLESTQPTDDLLNIKNFSIGKSKKSKINFKEEINLVKINEEGCFEIINFDSEEVIKIEENVIFLNSTYFEGFDSPAILEFHNISYNNPQIYKDGILCEVCNISNYTKNVLLEVEVPGFTNYSVVEGPFCGDNECNGNDTCTNCNIDCGNCPTPGGSSTTGSRSSTTSSRSSTTYSSSSGTCIEAWSCGEFSECIEGIKTKECHDQNNCSTQNRKPESEVGCIKQETPPQVILEDKERIDKSDDKSSKNSFEDFMIKILENEFIIIFIIIAIFLFSIFIIIFIVVLKKINRRNRLQRAFEVPANYY
jgi:hypothetical protein